MIIISNLKPCNCWKKQLTSPLNNQYNVNVSEYQPTNQYIIL